MRFSVGEVAMVVNAPMMTPIAMYPIVPRSAGLELFEETFHFHPILHCSLSLRSRLSDGQDTRDFTMTDKLILGGRRFGNTSNIGSGKYSLDLINAAVQNAGAEIIPLALRRANQGGTADISTTSPGGVTLLPNTSGARTADEPSALPICRAECGCGDFVKIEIVGNSTCSRTSGDHPRDPRSSREGKALSSCRIYPDLCGARSLVNAGAACIMPLAAPIGTNKGPRNARFHQDPHRRDRSSRSSLTPASAVRRRRARRWRWARRRIASGARHRDRG